MIYKIYSVKDRLAGYGVIVLQDNDAVAMRAFQNGCSDPSSTWSTHPNDFSLYCLGEFDTHSGDIISYEPKFICSADDFINLNKED